MVYVEHLAALRFFSDCFLRLPLGSQEKYALTLARLVGDVPRSFAEHLQGFLQVNNMDSVALAENVLLHFRVPAPRLVTEVNSGLQQLFHRNFDCQSTSSPLKGCFASQFLRTESSISGPGPLESGPASFFAGCLPAVNFNFPLLASYFWFLVSAFWSRVFCF
jgi:hypothetical protein